MFNIFRAVKDIYAMFQEIQKKLGKIDEIDGLKITMGEVQTKLGEIDGIKVTMDEVQSKVNTYEVRFDKIDAKIDNVEKELTFQGGKYNGLERDLTLIRTNHLQHLSDDLKSQTADINLLKGKLELLIELLNKQNKIL